MKRRSNKTRPAQRSRSVLNRFGPVLMGVAVAGVTSFPTPSEAKANLPPRVSITTGRFRTSGAVIEAWAFGTLSDASQPNSQAACDLTHVCALAISSEGGAGTGTGATVETFFESAAQGELPPNLPFTLAESIDYRHPITTDQRGDNPGAACYPGSGVMQITANASSILVLDIVGQACEVGGDTVQIVFTGSYVTDATSSGEFADPDGIGSLNINSPSGLEGGGSNMRASLIGQLLYGD